MLFYQFLNVEQVGGGSQVGAGLVALGQRAVLPLF